MFLMKRKLIIGKGPNGTLSIIFDGIKKLNSEKHLKITCNNAGDRIKITPLFSFTCI